MSLRSAPRELDVLQQRDAPVTVVIDSSAAWQPSSEASVTLTFDPSAPASITAPPWKGTVTGLPASVGAELHAGDPVLEVDGIRRVFAPSAAPLWRVPTWGDHGPDVDGLGALFASMQLMEPPLPGAPFGAEHVRAVERLASRIGAAPTSVLDLAWLVWSPVPTATLASWPITLGAPAPAPGSVLIPLARTVTAVAVESSGGTRVTEDELRRSTVAFGGDPPVPGERLLDAPEQIPAVRRAAEAGTAPGATNDPRGGDGGGAGEPGGGGGAGASAGAQALSAGAAPAQAQRTLTATVRGARVDHVAPLPLSAVVTDPDGTHCVLSLERRSTPVEVIGSDAARVFVRGAGGQQIVANPASAFGATTCH